MNTRKVLVEVARATWYDTHAGESCCCFPL